MFGLIDGLVDTACDFVENPIGTSVNIATQPLRDALEIATGLTEGELRVAAAARLGADVVSGMALGEVIEYMSK